MSDLSVLVKDTFPANEQVGIPLLSVLTITLSGLDYDEDSLTEGLFVEGPDTDQFVGPGQIDLFEPANISQGDADDFLHSPGYQGIVVGTTTVSGIDGDTVVSFTPDLPMAPLIEYSLNLTGVLDAAGDDIDGFVTFSFITGSGSITELPASISSSILNSAYSESGQGITINTAFSVVKSTPLDHAIDQSLDLEEIVIEFNKEIDPDSVLNNITVQTVPLSDHPNLSSSSLGDLAITTEVVGNLLKIRI